jgi:hypothetical protein
MTAWYDYDIGHGYITGYQGAGTDTPHYAYDLETPFHTPLTAPLSGTVKQADYAAWGGEIFIQPDDKSLPEYYFYHPDEVEVSKGQHVNAGQLIALSGGENPGYPGAEHPASTEWSTGPHTHIGWFTNWQVTPEGTRPYGPEPHALIEDAKNMGSGGGSAFNVPSDIYNAVEPIAKSQGVPDKVWESVAYVESGFNAKATGDNNSSFGLFQLHQGGQLGSLSEQQAFDPATNAKAAMPAISKAWKDLEPTFNATSDGWWEAFAIESGHPGGSLEDPATQTESQKLKNAYNTGSTGTITTGAQDVANGVNDVVGSAISGAETAFTGWVSQNAGPFALRIGIGLLGCALVVIGTEEIVAAMRGESGSELAGRAVGKVKDIAEVAAV